MPGCFALVGGFGGGVEGGGSGGAYEHGDGALDLYAE